MEPRMEHPKRRLSICIFSCRLSWGFFLSSLLILASEFFLSPRFFFFSCYGRGNSAMPWWNSNIVWVSENLKRNMKRFQGDSSGRKVFSADPVTCMMGIYDKMITSTATAEISLKPRIWDLFKSPRRSCTNSDPRLLSLTRNVSSSSKYKNFFFQLDYDAQSKIRSIEKVFSAVLRGHPSIWNLSTCSVT